MDSMDFGSHIRGITANVNRFISNKLVKYGIRQGQYEYFMFIYANPGINQLELARHKNVGKASVTKAVRILEENGFVYREVDENDKRNYRCHITKKGEEIIDGIKSVRSAAERELFKGFSKEDKGTLFMYLVKLHTNSEELVGKGVLE